MLIEAVRRKRRRGVLIILIIFVAYRCFRYLIEREDRPRGKDPEMLWMTISADDWLPPEWFTWSLESFSSRSETILSSLVS
jgi:hypothetical protein